MTIIKPKKLKDNSRLVFILAFLAVFAAIAAVYIYEYNELASLRYEGKRLKAELGARQAENSDLRNRLYEKLDSMKWQDVLENQNLVLEPKPKYLNLKTD